MEKFRELFEEARNKERSKKGLQPHSGDAPTRAKGPSIIVGGPDKQLPLQRCDDALPWETPEHAIWQKTSSAMKSLEPVFMWVADHHDAIISRLSLLEDRCKQLAISGQRQEFLEARRLYFQVIENLCEMYFRDTGLPSRYPLPLAIGLKFLKFKIGEPQPGESPSNDIEFYVREIPYLLIATQEQLEDIFKTKSTTGGTVINVTSLLDVQWSSYETL